MPVFVEKDDHLELVERYGVVNYPAFVWTDAKGEVVSRTVQPDTVEELLDELELASEELERS